MKKIIIIIILIAKCNVLFSQEENFEAFFVDAVTKGVPVYSNDTCANHFTIIREYEKIGMMWKYGRNQIIDTRFI